MDNDEWIAPYWDILMDYKKHTKEEHDNALKVVEAWIDRQPKYEPPEFSFITKLKENKKWYYKEDDDGKE